MAERKKQDLEEMLIGSFLKHMLMYDFMHRIRQDRDGLSVEEAKGEFSEMKKSIAPYLSPDIYKYYKTYVNNELDEVQAANFIIEYHKKSLELMNSAPSSGPFASNSTRSKRDLKELIDSPLSSIVSALRKIKHKLPELLRSYEEMQSRHQYE